MENLNRISPGPVVLEHEVIVLSDSENEENFSASNVNSVIKSTSSQQDSTIISETHHDTTITNDIENSDILNEVIQLIDWVNSYAEDRQNSARTSTNVSVSPKKKFMNGFLFIENLQTQFEENQKSNTKKDDCMAAILEENKNLKSQLQTKNVEFEKLKLRNDKLEKERNQRKKEGQSLWRLRSKMANLQGYFGVLIGELEKEPVNPLDPRSVQKRHDIEIFKKEVNELFNKVQIKLKDWDKNQREMEGELESTRLVIEKLHEMVVVTEKFRSTNNILPASPSPSPLSSSSSVSFSPASSPAKPKQKRIPATATTSVAVTNDVQLSKKRKMPPPALLPLTTSSYPSASRVTASKNFPSSPSAAITRPPPSPNQENSCENSLLLSLVPKMHQLEQQQKEMDSLLTSLAALKPIPPKSTTPTQLENQLNSGSISSFSSTHPPLPRIYFPIHSATATATFVKPLKPPPMSRKTANKTSTITSSSALGSEPLPRSFQPIPNSMPSTSAWPPATATATSSSSLSLQQLHNSQPPYNPPPLPKNMTPFKTPTRPALQKRKHFSPASDPIPSTKHTLPPFQLPVLNPTALPQSMEVQVPEVHQREAIEIFGGPTTSQPKPCKGQNVCGLCGMSFNTLIQLKIHHTVVHSKGPTAGSSLQAPTQPCPLRPLGGLFQPPPLLSVRRNASNQERITSQHVSMAEENTEPVNKRLRPGQFNPTFSSMSPFSSRLRPSSLSSLGEHSSSFGRISSAENSNNSSSNSANSNENSVYPFL